jgi:hypothetical protein
VPLDEEQPLHLSEGRIGREMDQIPYEPLLPVEKQLIAGSLILGVVLLGLLVWVSYTFFPAP